MADTHGASYSFAVDGEQADLFQVVEFHGQDELSKPYAFVVTLASRNEALTPEAMVGRKASLRILGENRGEHGSNAYSGVIFSFHYLRARDDILYFRASLTPRLRLLALTQHNQVFLNQSLPQILASVFAECGLTDYELRLAGAYPPLEYVCQYNESSLNFVSRLMEHNGLYYWFEEADSGEKLVVADTLTAHARMPSPTLTYLPVSGLDDPEREFKVSQLVCERKIVPAKVLLRDYNYQLPTLDLTVTAEVDPAGQGVYYNYGDYYQTVEEGQALARIRVQEILAGQEVFTCASTVPRLRAGALMTLSGHPVAAYDTDFLVTGVEHSGRDKSLLDSGLSGGRTDRPESEAENFYRNAFKAIYAAKQYRPPRTAEKSRFHGMLHALVDAEGDGKYAMLDELGRYKIRLPFDLAGRPAAHASHWLRLAEPYAGPECGMHFPLIKGAEVLLAFIDGDPDRPVIASSVYNAANPNLVRDANNALNTIKTAGNNQIVMGDVKGQEFMGLYSPFHSSSILLGSTKTGGGGSLEFKTKGESETLIIGSENKAIGGTANEVVVGSKTEIMAGLCAEFTAGVKTEYTFGPKFDYKYSSGLEVGAESLSFFSSKEVSGTDKVELKAGMSPLLKAALTSMKNTYHKVAFGTAVSAAASSVFTESFTTDGAFNKSGSSIGQDIGVTAAGLVPAGVVLGLAIKYLQKSIAAFNQASSNAYVSVMELTSNGFTLEVCGQKSSPTKTLATPINIEAIKQSVPGVTDYSSAIQIKDDGNVVSIINKEGTTFHPAELVMTGGSNAKLSVHGAGALTLAGPTATPTITLAHNDPNTKLVMTKGDAKLSAAADCSLEVKADSVVMQAGTGDSISVTKQGIVMKFGGGNMHAGALKVDDTGKVMLG